MVVKLFFYLSGLSKKLLYIERERERENERECKREREVVIDIDERTSPNMFSFLSL